MNKFEVIEQYTKLVSELQVPSNKVVLSAGGALVILGLRDTTKDLDVAIPASDFYKCVTNKGSDFVVDDNYGNWRFPYNDSVDMHVLKEDYPTIMVGNVCINTPMNLLEQKKWLLNNPTRSADKKRQDEIDIGKLNEYLDNL